MNRVNICLCKSKLYITKISLGKLTVLNNNILNNQNIFAFNQENEKDKSLCKSNWYKTIIKSLGKFKKKMPVHSETGTLMNCW